MTQIVEYSLPRDNYLEYLRLLRSHGIAVADCYARVVSSPKYIKRKPLSLPRIGRGARK